MLGEYSLATEDYERMIQLDPDNAESYIRKAVIFFALGRMEEALQGFDQSN